MKWTFAPFAIFCVLLGILVVSTGHFAWAEPLDARWKKVEEANRKGLPKTAIEQLEPIIAGALKKKAYGEAVKAIGLKIALESNIQGNKPEEKITRMQAEIARAPEEMKPVMEAILANWYWHYFLQNRYRFLQRTQTAAPPGEDFTTWDLPRILGEIDKQFGKAFAYEDKLKATPVAAYNQLLQKGTVPDSYRPTMFDFLAFNTLDFYSSGEQGAIKAEDSFELSADSPIFGPVDEFMVWKPESTDTDSPTLKAIRLYQDLLTFHRNDKDKTAFIDADLWRLHFGKNKAVGEEKNDRYKAALQRFLNEWPSHEISTRALFELATILKGEGEALEAHKLARRGADLFPNSIGGRMCFNLVQQIEAKSANISTERVWNEPLPSIRVIYRNVAKVFFRVVPYDFEEFISSRRWSMGSLDHDQQQKLLASKPALAWSADLPPTVDFRERVEKLPAPGNLKPGCYFLLSSHDPSFGATNNQVSYAPVWVSDLALVMRSRNFEGVTEGFVLNAVTGEPVAGASVRVWERNRNTGRFEPIDPARSDQNGLFRFTLQNQACVFLAEQNEQRLATSHDYAAGVSQREPVPYTRTVFFTDRSLYRPGQTVNYKGICLLSDQAGNQYKTLGGRDLTVLFYDANHKEIARQKLRTNDYGSFSGSFTAPRDRLTGRMTIQAQDGPAGSTSFNIEEYKRPKFKVELTAPKEAARLSAEVSLPGKAIAFTGAAIGGAKVKYRVVREIRFPIWCWWALRILPPGRQESQAIAHGTAETQNDGTFTISFIAKPDLSVREKDEPKFEFTVYADVTDTTGETRSAQHTVRAGYTALQAALSAAEWQTSDKPVEITIDSKTLDGEGQAATGTLKVYALRQPATVRRPDLDSGRKPFPGPSIMGPDVAREWDLSGPNSWEAADSIYEQPFQTGEGGSAKVPVDLKPGIYRVMLDTKDRFGKAVTARLTIQVADLKANQFPVKIPNHFAAEKWSVEPGESLKALWGSGYDKGRAFVEIEHRGKMLNSYWTGAGHTQEVIEQAVGEELRGGFSLRVTYVRENRAYLNERIVDVPWTNKNLTVKWEHFNSKLGPGAKETWTAVVSGPDAKKAAAEMVAGLYDASLDAYLPHQWMGSFAVFRRETSRVRSEFENRMQPLQQIFYGWRSEHKDVELTYRAFPHEIISYIWGYGYAGAPRGGRGGGVKRKKAAAPSAGRPLGMAASEDAAPPPMPMAAPMAEAAKSVPSEAADEEAQQAQPDLSKVSARKNLNETAFFFPHLLTDADGRVKIEFNMPEALTEWKFMGFAHDRELRGGLITDKALTAKDLMVEPNPPRFVREGDTIEFTVKVSNQTDTQQTGRVKLAFTDARTLKPVDAELSNNSGEQPFDIPGRQSRSFAWRVTIPDGMDFLAYKAVGASERLSDGEEGYLPVLSRRILVSESLPLPVCGKQTKNFSFTKLIESGKSPSLQHQNLTVQMVSQPAWYAVMSLPYLMEFPYECTEQTFNRLYANALARHIANSDPKIRRIFNLWKETPALDSPLEKNQDLKAVMLEETPWLRQAQNESRSRRNVGLMFDGNRLNEETKNLLRKLAEQQLSEGSWPWFPGGPPNNYITLYITTGFGRLRHLGVEIDASSAVKSLGSLDKWINNTYREILRNPRKDDNHLNSTIALYLYGRSFFLKDKPIEGAPREAVDYFLGQAKKYWLQLSYRQSQAHLAVALKRFGDQETATAIMKSIKERSVSSEEFGMFWRDLELSWWWFRAPIETQAMMVEAFDEVMQDAKAVEECKVWLLKQKQTQDWKTTKATADAIYALMLRGTNLLSSDALVEVSLAGQAIKPEKVEAGTGFYEKRFTRGEIKPELGNITVTKTDEGVSWGSAHWQYFEDIARITPHEGTPLKLKKALFVKETTKKGQELKPVAGPLAVGDELVVRIELRVDRDMEYVHMKDQRGSGTEPVNVLSRYKFRDGLAYYESTRDTAGHFFIDYLPKGTYVFEYSTRVQLKGRYQTGIASIQCMYAPEFNSHSESFDLEVK
ncbi:MAG: alpha-2-macroglobulin [Syntrophobacteraceae bacterium]